MIFVVAVVMMAFAYGAVRIVLGWVLPVGAVQRIDRFLWAACVLYFKLIVVLIGGLPGK